MPPPHIQDVILPTQTEVATPRRRPWSGASEYYASGRLGTAILVLAYFALWTVTGRYWGLQHDAQAYAAQAFARLHPDPLAGDLFLRYRSQDDVTLFPFLAAWPIEWLGLDHGAAALAFVFFAGWLALAWRLSRALQGRRTRARGVLGVAGSHPAGRGGAVAGRAEGDLISARPAPPDFVVDDENLGVEVARLEWPTRAKFQCLYDCETVRRPARVADVAAWLTDRCGQET